MINSFWIHLRQPREKTRRINLFLDVATGAAGGLVYFECGFGNWGRINLFLNAATGAAGGNTCRGCGCGSRGMINLLGMQLWEPRVE